MNWDGEQTNERGGGEKEAHKRAYTRKWETTKKTFFFIITCKVHTKYERMNNVT